MVGPGGCHRERLFDDTTQQIGTTTEVSQTRGSLPNTTQHNTTQHHVLDLGRGLVIMFLYLIQVKLKIQFLTQVIVSEPMY